MHLLQCTKFSGLCEHWRHSALLEAPRTTLLWPQTQAGMHACDFISALFLEPVCLSAPTSVICLCTHLHRIVILEYQAGSNSFDVIHKETYGKSACRRIVPGAYLATDPKGRAVMIAYERERERGRE